MIRQYNNAIDKLRILIKYINNKLILIKNINILIYKFV